MAPTNVGYSFKEAISHFFRNWTTSLGAVITIFLSLFIIGLFIMGSAVLNSGIRLSSTPSLVMTPIRLMFRLLRPSLRRGATSSP